MRSGFLLTVSALVLSGGGIVCAADFEKEVLPIFSQRCGKCHMEGKAKGGLDLNLEKIAREIGPSKAIVPGDAEKSELMQSMLLKEDDEDCMPPEGPRVPEAELTIIKSWIAEGAKLPTDKPETAEKGKTEEKAPPAEPGKPETWTSTAGTSVTATLTRVDVTRKTIVLLREDGKTFEVPIDKLDEDSKTRARAFWEAHK